MRCIISILSFFIAAAAALQQSSSGSSSFGSSSSSFSSSSNSAPSSSAQSSSSNFNGPFSQSQSQETSESESVSTSCTNGVCTSTKCTDGVCAQSGPINNNMNTFSQSGQNPGGNSNQNSMMSSSSSSSFNAMSNTESCQNGKCIRCSGPNSCQMSVNGDQICVNGKCFQGSQAWMKDSCMIAVCPADSSSCNGFVLDSRNNCPVCQCNGYITREPCNSNSDCEQGGQCNSGLCHYGAIADSQVVQSCAQSNQCPENQICQSGSCAVPQQPRFHQTGVSCMWDYQCKADHFCDQFTCWAGATIPHVEGQQCVFANSGMFGQQCPQGFDCVPSKFTCYATPQMGSSRN